LTSEKDPTLKIPEMTKKISIHDTMEQARQLEAEGKMTEAIKPYTAIVQQDPLYADAYNRLMIIYRKQKRYKEELQIIKQAIKAFEESIKSNQSEWKKGHAKAARLSRSLAESLGLLNKKGMPVYEEPHVTAWRKRMETVSKKIEAAH